MNSLRKKLIATGLLALALCTSAPASAQQSQGQTQTGSESSATAEAVCKGRMFNPFSDTDWNQAFPITVMGISMGGGTNPPMMYEPPVCVCPGPFGIPSVGVGITYWEPLYVSEIQRVPGCMSTLGGVSILDDYMSLHGEHEQGSDGGNSGTTTRMQGHWYQYPVMTILDMFKDAACKSTAGFALAYITEIDPTWQDDTWGAVFAPEASLFANPVAQAACAIDTVAANFAFPLDPMFWCLGGWGSTYPLTGNSGPGNNAFLVNSQIQAKFMARLHRMGLLWQTIGPSAICFSHPNPIIIKSQYRINQIAPIARSGKPLVIGDHGAQQYPQVTNPPSMESTDNLIWQGQQCCARLY
jgi:conjugal transfer pilus assembly protein TraU